MTGKVVKPDKYIIEDADAKRDILFANTIPEAKKQAKRILSQSNKVIIRELDGLNLIFVVRKDANNKIEFHDHREYLQWKKSGRRT